MNRPLKKVIDQKTNELQVVSPTTTVLAAVDQMKQHNVGALLVLHQGDLVGIFTERDVLIRVVASRQDLNSIQVQEVMTENVLTVDDNMGVLEAISLMLEKNIRHLPVLRGDRSTAIVSMRDLAAWVIQRQKGHITDLESYIRSVY